MRLVRSLLSILLASGLASAAAAQGADAAAHWRALTLMDVDAAHAMISEDHPGAAEELGDVRFQRQLASAYAAARARAAEVTSYDGYVATLAGFSVSLGDKHIWSRPLYVPDTRDWAGILIARRGRDWVVAEESEAVQGAPLKGAKLVSCDGVPADRLAEERLGGYRIVWSIEAQRIQRAYWLLVDDGNPFLKRPRQCRLLQDGAARSVDLNWRSIRRTDLTTHLAALKTRGAAGFGVRQVGEGQWIGIESLSEKALPVVEEVKARAAELRRAPYVVLDLRGNGGGSSHFGRQVAEALYGPAFVAAKVGGDDGGEECSKVWRVSERNLKQLDYYKERLGPQFGKEAVESFTREYDSVAAAKAAGKPFSGPVKCSAAQARAKPKAAAAKPASAGKVFLLTDNSCFSSCLLVTDEFRRLGAIHVGEATDANTNYMEVREDKLPSGLSMFSTLQAVAPGQPSQIGSFAPAHVFEGAISDTAALEAWIARLAAS